MTHDSDGKVLDVGRKTRTISPALRRALRFRDQSCRFPGCGVTVCDGHHIRHWADGGDTSLDNLVLLCRRHHRSVHVLRFQWEHESCKPDLHDPYDKNNGVNGSAESCVDDEDEPCDTAALDSNGQEHDSAESCDARERSSPPTHFSGGRTDDSAELPNPPPGRAGRTSN